MACGVSRYFNLDVNCYGLICACRFYFIFYFPYFVCACSFWILLCLLSFSLSLFSLSFSLQGMWSARWLLAAPHTCISLIKPHYLTLLTSTHCQIIPSIPVVLVIKLLHVVCEYYYYSELLRLSS